MISPKRSGDPPSGEISNFNRGNLSYREFEPEMAVMVLAQAQLHSVSPGNTNDKRCTLSEDVDPAATPSYLCNFHFGSPRTILSRGAESVVGRHMSLVSPPSLTAYHSIYSVSSCVLPSLKTIPSDLTVVSNMGTFSSIINESVYPGTPSFTAADIPDMSGKVVLITGATAGIGKETARVLLTKNAKVWITARDLSKGETALKELKDITGKYANLLVMNLANLKSVKAAAQEFNSKETQLNVLFNNAGVMIPPINLLTDDGYDLQFGTNVLGHFYFTKLVLPILLSTAKSAPDGIARVVNVSSNGHWFGGLEYDTMKDGPARRKSGAWKLYGQSKTGNIVFAAELTRRYADQGIVSTSLNPGAIKSNLTRHSNRAAQLFFNAILYPVSYGAITQLYAGTVADGKSLNGMHLVPWARIGTPRADTQDPEVGKKLWEYLEQQVKDV